MIRRRQVVVVDGSNLATEGRSSPSLNQLDDAVRAFIEEHPDNEVVVVVDATFEHRVAPAERERVKQAELNGEIVTPPAGAIGRGDAFILKIAKRADAVVVSNDSFQEFHAEHPWLFDDGRLIGGKPVPRIGWIFTPRNPVRGPRSKQATKRAAREIRGEQAPEVGEVRPATRARATSAKKVAKATRRDASAERAESAKAGPAKAAAKKSAKAPEPKRTPTAPKRSARQEHAEQPRAAKAAAKRQPVRPQAAKAAPAKAAAKASNQASSKARAEPVNTPRSFHTLVADHSLGGIVKGEVVQFTSHGAMVSVPVGRTMHVVCYAPLAGLGTPSPTRARDVLKKGEVRRFKIVSFDATRRRAELSLPAR